MLGLLSSLLLLNQQKGSLFQFHKNSDALITLAEDIRYYDEVLSMSANMAAMSHSLQWIERYEKADRELAKTIAKAKEVMPESTVSLNDIEKSNKALVALERKAIEFVKQGKYQGAQRIMSGEEYNEYKALYMRGFKVFQQFVESEIHRFDDEAKKQFERLILIISVVILLTASFFFWSIIVARKQTYELKASKDSIKTQHKFLQNIINLVPVRIFWKDLNGVYLGANEAFVKDAQLSSVSQILGKTDYDMTWKKDAERFRADDAKVVNSGVPQLQYEEEQPKEDGSVIYLRTSKVPLVDTHDKVIGILGVYDDITEQTLLEREKKAQETQLFKQARHAQMGEMIAMIAHQWRQPLSSIAATVGTLQMKRIMGKTTDEFLEKELNRITEYTQHLSKTIDDFRSFFKEDKTMQETTLEAVSDDSLSILEPTLKISGIAVVRDYQCNESLLSLPNELKQVLINLLKNAQEAFDDKQIKDKSIGIKTYKKDNRFYIEVYDNAGGINEAIIEKVFDPYYTTKGSLNGTGLGLYMSKIIIEDNLSGKITATNQNGGVSFLIELS